MTYTLYGMPSSLYTGKARSYLRKQGIDFVESSPGCEHYLNDIVPAIGRWIVPVLETPSGELIQDGADIIDHFEKGPGRHLVATSAYPSTPRQLAASRVFEIYGGEGLFRTGLHYRWNYPEQLPFIESEFALMYATRFTAEEVSSRFAKQAARLGQVCEVFGITDETIPTLEDSFVEFLRLFDTHLVDHPFLLGAQPTIGDYGLMAGLWGHLYRDPIPGSLMKIEAPRVARWVERMSTLEPYLHEYGGVGGRDYPEGLIGGDEVPSTVRDLMRFVSVDHLPELRAHVEVANRWLAAQPASITGTNGQPDPGARGLTEGGADDAEGVATFDWRGHRITTPVLPYRIWLMQRMQTDVETNGAAGERAVRELFDETGLAELLELRTVRPVERIDNREVWGELR